MFKFKKILSSIVIAALLVGGASTAYTATSNLINQKVQQIVKVKVNGKQINSEGIVINGVTYVPMRAIGNEIGLSSSYKDGVVSMSSVNEGITDGSNDGGVSQEIIDAINKSIESYKGNIQMFKDDIVRIEADIEKKKKEFADMGFDFESTPTYSSYLEMIKKNEESIKFYEDLIVKDQKHRDELLGN